MMNHYLVVGVALGCVSAHVVAQPISSLRIDPVPITRETTVAKSFGKAASGVDLVAYQTPLPPSIVGPPMVGIGFQESTQIRAMGVLPQSHFHREYQGGIWAETPLRWSPDRRFAIFESEEKLAIIDTETQLVLLNNAFTGFSKSPIEDRWAAIRYRPTGRNQEGLTGNERDTVWFIEPAALAERVEMVTDANPFAHVAAVQVTGIAVARPHWSEDGASVAIVRQLDGKLAADVFDPVTRALVRTVPLQGLTLTQEQLLSVRIIPEIDRSASEAIKANHVFDTSRSQMTSPQSVKQPEVKMRGEQANTAPGSSPTPGGETRSSSGFRIVPVAIVAAVVVGIVLFLVRRKST